MAVSSLLERTVSLQVEGEDFVEAEDHADAETLVERRQWLCMEPQLFDLLVEVTPLVALLKEHPPYMVQTDVCSFVAAIRFDFDVLPPVALLALFDHGFQALES